jgi:hypothetical protein
MVKVVSILSDIKLVLRPVETETASWAMNIVWLESANRIGYVK